MLADDELEELIFGAAENDLSTEEWNTLAAHFDAPAIPDIDAKILAAIEAGGQLDMSEWHICETTHCRAGWAIHLAAGGAGYKLEERLGDPELAGQLIYVASGYALPPNFHASNEDAMREIREAAARTGAP